MGQFSLVVCATHVPKYEGHGAPAKCKEMAG